MEHPPTAWIARSICVYPGLVLCLLLARPTPVQNRIAAPPLPRFVELKLAGLDLLHTGAETLQRRYDRAQVVAVPTGRAYRYFDPRENTLLEVILDEESDAVKIARVIHTAFSPLHPLTPSPIPPIRLPRPLTGAGLSLGAPPAAVERALGRPHKIERGKDSHVDYLYRAPMRPDGSLPAYRARYSFVNGRLDGIAIAFGE